MLRILEITRAKKRFECACSMASSHCQPTSTSIDKCHCARRIKVFVLLEIKIYLIGNNPPGRNLPIFEKGGKFLPGNLKHGQILKLFLWRGG